MSSDEMEPVPGAIYCVRLEGIGVGCVRVVRVNDSMACRYCVVSITPYVGDQLPELSDPALSQTLTQNRGPVKGVRRSYCLEGEVPASYLFLGVVDPAEDDSKLAEQSWQMGEWPAFLGAIPYLELPEAERPSREQLLTVKRLRMGGDGESAKRDELAQLDSLAMASAEFWTVMERSFGPDKPLRESLQDLEGDLVSKGREFTLGFLRALVCKMDQANTELLRAGSTLVGASGSSDHFEDFRAWLITRGEATYNSVLANPEGLADIPFKECTVEEWYFEPLHLLGALMEKRHGALGGLVPSLSQEVLGSELEVTPEILKARFPRLWAKFGSRYLR